MNILDEPYDNLSIEIIYGYSIQANRRLNALP